jgi:hypothetical protein
MKRQAIVGCFFITASFFPAAVTSAQTAVNVSAQIGNFHVAVANYYHVPEREVVVVHERHIPDDDLPVVFFIAREARVPPARVIELRDRGRSWWDISVHFGLRPDVYYVPVAYDPGPPYGHAYGHYKKPKGEWRTIRLTDDDVVNLVQLRFLSEHYGIPADRVMAARSRNAHVVAMYSDIGDRKRSGHWDDDDHDHDHDRGRGASASEGHGNSNGKGKGNGRGKGHD